jgi:uncharacterized membrane protein YfcA
MGPDMGIYIFLPLAGGGGGFLSGLLGIGGGIVMFPVLLYLPPLLGIGSIDVKSITGLTMVQGFFASLSGMLFYRRKRLVNKKLVLSLGLSLFASSLAGSLLSKKIPDHVLLLIFGALAFLASILMLIPRNYDKDNMREHEVTFNNPLGIGIGLVIGSLLGMVGQGGAFITIPIMLYVLRIPLRVALGSTLAIGLFSATAGIAGKVATGQIPFIFAVLLVSGAIPAARLGGMVSKRTDTKFLKWLLAFLIFGTAIKIWADII